MYKHGLAGKRFAFIWHGMKARCTNKKNPKYKIYGEKGVRVEWRSLIEFKKDMFNSYSEHCLTHGEKNTQIDRMNSEGNYSKTNCRWATIREQNHNRRGIKLYRFEGENRTLFEISLMKGLSKNALYERVKKGWSISKVLNT